MRTAGTEHRRTYRQFRRLVCCVLLRRLPAQKGCQICRHAVAGILSGKSHVLCQLAADTGGQVVLAAEVHQFLFNDRIQLLQTQHLVQSLQKLHCQLFRKRERCCHFQQPRCSFAVQGFHGIGKADAMGGNALLTCGICFRIDPVAGIVGKDTFQFGIPLFHTDMILIGQLGKNHPLGGVFHKPLRRVDLIFCRIFHRDRSVAMTDSGRRAKQHRCVVTLRIGKRLLNHVIGFLHAGGVEAGQLGERRKPPRILFGLRGDRPGVVCHQYHHAAFDTNICQAHQRIRSHVQPHLLHGHHGSCTAVRRTGSQFHCRFFVCGPLHINAAVIVLGSRFQHLGRRRSGIAGNHVQTCRNGTHGNRSISH